MRLTSRKFFAKDYKGRSLMQTSFTEPPNNNLDVGRRVSTVGMVVEGGRALGCTPIFCSVQNSIVMVSRCLENPIGAPPSLSLRSFPIPNFLHISNHISCSAQFWTVMVSWCMENPIRALPCLSEVSLKHFGNHSSLHTNSSSHDHCA